MEINFCQGCKRFSFSGDPTERGDQNENEKVASPKSGSINLIQDQFDVILSKLKSGVKYIN